MKKISYYMILILLSAVLAACSSKSGDAADVTGTEPTGTVKTDTEQAGTDITGTEQSNADITDTEQSDADIADNEQTGTDITDAEKADTDITGTEQSNADITDTEQADTDITGTEQSNADITDSEQTDTDITDTEQTGTGIIDTEPDGSDELPADWNPDITFQTTDLNMTEWDDSCFADAKLTMINLWAYWCGPCVSELPEINKLSGEFADKGFQVFGLTYPEEEKENLKTIKKLDLSYPMLLYTEDFDRYMDSGYLPTTVFVDSNGHIIGKPVIGSKSYRDWKKFIEKYLAK